MHRRRQPHASGPFAGMTDDDISALDDAAYDARIDAYVGQDDRPDPYEDAA